MNPSREELKNSELLNVVSLFGNTNEEVILKDPLADLIAEGEFVDETEIEIPMKARKVVNEDQFPDQSLFTLDEQLANLRSNVNRMKFYLGELEDLLPG